MGLCTIPHSEGGTLMAEAIPFRIEANWEGVCENGGAAVGDSIGPPRLLGATMDPLQTLQHNILTPPVLAFLMGVVATQAKSDLRIPEEAYSTLSIYLLLSIGLKGGAEISVTPFAHLGLPLLAALAAGCLTPLIAFGVLRRLGRFDVANAAAIAAHYGSVSVVTFTATLTFLDAAKVPYEHFVPALVVVMEIPAIVIALMLAQRSEATAGGMRGAVREVITGKSVVLLTGGLVIGALSGKPGLERVAPLFVAPFYGALTLFLLEMGMVAARRVREVRRVGGFLLAFALGMPLIHGALGLLLARAAGLSLGGATVMATLTASSSYIAAPAAVRIALPRANPSYYLTASLGITFPFNLTLGIPIYYTLARLLYGT